MGFYRNEETLEPVNYYVKLASNMQERIALILDPMLATGGTLIATIDLLKAGRVYAKSWACFVVAAPEGIRQAGRKTSGCGHLSPQPSMTNGSMRWVIFCRVWGMPETRFSVPNNAILCKPARNGSRLCRGNA